MPPRLDSAALSRCQAEVDRILAIEDSQDAEAKQEGSTIDAVAAAPADAGRAHLEATIALTAGSLDAISAKYSDDICNLQLTVRFFRAAMLIASACFHYV